MDVYSGICPRCKKYTTHWSQMYFQGRKFICMNCAQQIRKKK